MSERKPPATEEELARSFAHLFDATEPETPEEIDTTLREAGYDSGQVVVRMRSIANRALEASPLNWRNRARQEVEEARTQRSAHRPTPSRRRVDIINTIEQLLARLQGRQVRLATHFRNFDQAADEDLASLLDDLEYLAEQQQRRSQKGKR